MNMRTSKESTFAKLVSVVSIWYDECIPINMLKVLFRDHIDDAHLLHTSSKTMELMNKLTTRGSLSPADLTLLYDTIKVTEQFGLEHEIKDKMPSFQIYKNIRDKEITAFTLHQQRLVKLGKSLSPSDVQTINGLYSVKHTDSWSLIMDLEHKTVISEENMDTFIDNLQTFNLNQGVKSLTEDIQKPSSNSGQASDIPNPSSNPGLACEYNLHMKPAALENLGNTCYMNSVLQIIVHTGALVHLLNRKNHKDSCTKPEKCVMCAVELHISTAFSNPGNTIKSQLLIRHFTEFKDFEWGRQHDADEFVHALLRAMDNSFNEEYSPIYKIFGHSIMTSVVCSKCHTVSTQSKTSIGSIHLPIGKHHSLEQMLIDCFSNEEILNGSNKYKCEICQEKVEAAKFVKLETIPKVLYITLMRYDVNQTKDNKKVDFPENLDLSPCIDKDNNNCDTTYHLYGIICHYGRKRNSGHYICHTKSNNEWYYLSDDKCQSEGIDDVLQENNAYILFYEKQDIPNPSSNPGQASEDLTTAPTTDKTTVTTTPSEDLTTVPTTDKTTVATTQSEILRVGCLILAIFTITRLMYVYQETLTMEFMVITTAALFSLHREEIEIEIKFVFIILILWISCSSCFRYVIYADFPFHFCFRIFIEYYILCNIIVCIIAAGFCILNLLTSEIAKYICYFAIAIISLVFIYFFSFIKINVFDIYIFLVFFAYTALYLCSF
ncbi:ubiquitin carboxyl-terminal hydrolase 23-like isoform X3 [Anneissia japonica]|uniref:ubiquitin carboxyl-terminal hydrolase 23-like isoform X3 n=1 Tax=Anneissia japonica TaxID=1529436 RepID=UPI0014255F36|nr:ubiquitin carboxyl-terminal hydrolase 23-like isoform X3 [Anneissia japonica]